MDWQPIETAPKDGTPVDLLAKRWRAQTDDFIQQRFTDYRWSDDERMVLDVSSGRYRPIGKGWTRNMGIFNGTTEDSHFPQGWCPTHWMPLPPPPRP